MFPFTPRLRSALERQRARTRDIEKQLGCVIPWVFHRNGKPIRSFDDAWRTACETANLTGRIPHDLRRTAVRNLERAGVARSAAMAMVGHKTEAIYRRYAIVDEAMLSEAAEKLGKLWVSQPSSDPQACGEGTKNANNDGAGGGNRTLTGRKAHGILSPARLPVSPLRRVCGINRLADRRKPVDLDELLLIGV